jgi:D-xylose transport system ATP-binding protein
VTQETATRAPLVEMRDMRVAFGGVHAVDGVTVDLFPGEIVALVGGNGAGKSTLIKALSGAHPADSGEIFIEGQPVTIVTPRDAKALGIETIYQTLALAENIDLADRISVMLQGKLVGTVDVTKDEVPMIIMVTEKELAETAEPAAQPSRCGG